MVPSVYVVLDAMPLTPNRKIDRKALPPPDARLIREPGFIPARTAVEARLAELFGQVLGLPQVGTEDDFFYLGGSSLLALQLCSRIRAELGVVLPMHALFARPTITALALYIDQLAAENGHQASGTAIRRIALAPYPKGTEGEVYAAASMAQQGLWFLYKLDPASTAYNIQMVVRLEGNLDPDALCWSLNQVVRRHEVLRTRFAAGGEGPMQIIAPVLDIPLSRETLVTHESGTPAAEIERRIAADACQPFDLERGPLIRATLLHANGGDYLLLSIHHIVADGWSLGVLQDELCHFYSSFKQGKSSSLPELPVQYADYSAWQRSRFNDAEPWNHLEHWKRTLSPPLPVLELPADQPRPAVFTYRGARIDRTISPPVARSLRSLAHQENTTLFVTLLAAFNVLLHRCTGECDLIVGTPATNREQAELECLIGFFVNMLPIRIDAAGKPTFREFLARTLEASMDALAHRDFPFELLVKELQPVRDRGRSPLFQIVFSMEEALPTSPTLAGLVWSRMITDPGISKFDLTLAVSDVAAGNLTASWEYSTALFNASTIERMAERYTMLLAGIVANPEERISQLELLSGEERDRVLVSFNATAEDYPRDRTVLEWIEERARVRPEEIAVVDGRGSISRGELERRAEQLAATLRGKGAGRGSPVGLCIERAIETVLGLLAVWKAGAAYVPLDPGYPGERLAFMLADSGARVLLTQSHLAGRFAAEEERGLKVVAIDQPWVGMQKGDPATPEDVAYVIYTSGSTGEPKGVEIGHRALQNLIWWFGRRSGLKETDGFLSVTSLSFDIAALELLLPLVTGARLVTAQREETLDGELLAARIRDSGATVMQATPVTWRLLLESGWKGGPGMSMWCGGEALSRELAERLLATGGTLWNLYGPTETTIWSALQGVERGSGPVAIGRPVGNTQIYILDQGLQAQPVGVPGEIYIGGEGVAMGYHGRRELTAERFLPNPFAGTGERLYRTGDRGRWREDGSLEYLGREDRQVKLHGFRMELEEIEGALRQHPSIAEAVVEVREEGARQRLVAYLVAQGAAPTAGEVRGFLGSRLPPSMVPSVYVVLDAMPLTPNRKIDRKALPPPGSFRPEKQPFVPPRTPLEQRLVGIFAAVLGVEQVGTEDGFFDLGGASIESIDIVARARQADIPLSVEMLFQHQTVAELASAVESELAAYEQPSS
jgi:amino acid adenylation domain-containing protein